MNATQLRELDAEIKRLDASASEARESADALVSKYRAEGKDPLKDKEAFEAIDAAYAVGDGFTQEAGTLRARWQRAAEIIGQAVPAEQKNAAAEAHMSVIQALSETDSYQAFLKGGRAELPGVEAMSRAQLLRALGSGGKLMASLDVDAMVAPDLRLYPPVPIPVRQPRVVDLITVGQTNSDTVKFSYEKTRTDAAAGTARGTAYSEATYEYDNDEASVRDIGHFVIAHRDNLADLGQLQTLLQGRLSTGLELKLESQVLSGDGIGENFDGILGNDDVAANTIYWDGTNDNRLDAIHRGITAVRLGVYQEPTAIGIHPSDYEDIILTKADDSGIYLMGQPASSTPKTIWGFPAVISSVFPSTTAVVGQWQMGATLWMRAGVTVRATDSHADQFTKRQVTILAELRAAFAVQMPDAFCPVSLT